VTTTAPDDGPGRSTAAGPRPNCGSADLDHAHRGRRPGSGRGDGPLDFAVQTGIVAAFFGPAGCWGVLGVAGFVGFLILAVSQYVHLHRP
jgi:hypothetical protein